MRARFVRGFVATGLIAAVQEAANGGQWQGTLRRALQGGAALATGGAVADALQDGEWTLALACAAAGGTGLLLIERLLQEDRGEN